MGRMDWDEKYQRGEAAWDKGVPSPAMRQYLARQTVRGLALVPGCSRGHTEGTIRFGGVAEPERSAEPAADLYCESEPPPCAWQ